MTPNVLLEMDQNPQLAQAKKVNLEKKIVTHTNLAVKRLIRKLDLIALEKLKTRIRLKNFTDIFEVIPDFFPKFPINYSQIILFKKFRDLFRQSKSDRNK